jgi:hypothetical protein
MVKPMGDCNYSKNKTESIYIEKLFNITVKTNKIALEIS